MATTRRDTETIGGFSFEWVLFSDLTGLSNENNDLSRFNRVDNRFGVYIFIHESGNVPYIGLSGEKPNQNKYMKHRIGQHFNYTPSTGFTFGNNWMAKHYGNNWKAEHGEKISYFRQYIARCKLGTLSISSTNLDEQQKFALMKNPGVLGDMEISLICKYKPAYNKPFLNTLSDDERNRLDSFVEKNIDLEIRRPNTSPLANPSG